MGLQVYLNKVCVNHSTELKVSFAEALRRYLVELPGEFDPRKYFAIAREAVRKWPSKKYRWPEETDIDNNSHS